MTTTNTPLAVPQTRRGLIARVLTDVLAPVPVGVIALVLIAARYAPSLVGALVWIAVSILLVTLVPLAYIIYLLRRGEISDLHLRRREQRPRIILVSLVSWLVALVVLVAFGAPWQLIAFLGAGLIAFVVSGAITLRWKISFHTGVAGGVLTVLTLIFGTGVLLMLPLLLILGWARVELRDHTPAQVIAGALVGGSVSGIVFALLVGLSER